MRAIVKGEVVELETSPGSVNKTTGEMYPDRVRVFLKPRSIRFAADSYECPPVHAPKVGTKVEVECEFRAYNGKRGGFLSVVMVEPESEAEGSAAQAVAAGKA